MRKDHGFGITTCTRNGFASQTAVDMDRTIGDDLGTWIDHSQNHQITSFGIHLLTGTKWFVDHHGAHW